MITCPNCGHEQKFQADTTYFVNPDHPYNVNRRFGGFLCYGCHSVVYVREDGLLDIHYLGEFKNGKFVGGKWTEGVKPKHSSEYFGVEVK